MANVEKLREELMGSLGFEVERQKHTPPSRAAGTCRDARQIAPPGRGGKARRRLSESKAAVKVGVPYPQALRLGLQQGRQEHVYGERMVDTNGYTRPQSAKPFRASRNRGRPMSASSARCPRGHMNGSGSANKDMDILMEICRDQGRAGSLNPADFDSR